MHINLKTIKSYLRLEEIDQDGGVKGPGAHFPHEHINNIPTCGILLTENQLETGRRTPVQQKL